MQKSVENSRASATLGQITLLLRQRRQISFVKEGHPWRSSDFRVHTSTAEVAGSIPGQGKLRFPMLHSHNTLNSHLQREGLGMSKALF